MASINRNKLSHGTKLVPQHLNSSISATAEVISTGTIDQGQIGVNKNYFYVHWNIPVARSTWGEYTNLTETPFPFILCPTQDEFSSQFQTNERKITLEELSFSFDQMENAVAINDYFDPDKWAGQMFNGVNDNYSIRLKIYEKTPELISGSIIPEVLVHEIDITSNLFDAIRSRSNPFLQSDLNIPINPYKTYIITLSFPNGLIHSYTTDGTTVSRHAMMPNINMKAKFKSHLLTPDSLNEIVIIPQNVPTIHYGQNQYPPNFTYETWNAGDQITADNGKGIQKELDKIDYYTVKGYRSGLTDESDIMPNATIKDFYGYDVICVPIFQSLEAIRRGMIYEAQRKDFLPYVTNTATDPDKMMDRRMIHISYPFVIHQVLCSVSFYANKTDLLKVAWHGVGTKSFNTTPGYYRPTGSQLKREVGVFIGSGIRADNYDIQQVAYCQMDETYNQYRIDRMQTSTERQSENSHGSWKESGGRLNSPDVELWQVPLNWNATRGGYGFTENGAPFFTGQGNLRTKDRQEVYGMPFDFGGAGVPSAEPKTKGMEQWIEVRGSISDPVALGRYNNTHPYLYNETVIGRGGWYVYLIGKRALT